MEYKKLINFLIGPSGRINSNKSMKIKIPIKYKWCRTKQEYYYAYQNNLLSPKVCKSCDSNTKFKTFQDGYNIFCSPKCKNNDIDKINISNKNIKATKLLRYGDENYCNTSKIKETKLLRYGDENYNNADKNKSTCVLRYGVSNISKLPEIRKIAMLETRKTREKLGHWIPLDKKKLYDLYKREVYIITNSMNLSILKNIDKRGMAGINNAYHLDHKFSILEGFNNNILPYYIGNIINLEMIPWGDNYTKKAKCSILQDELYIKN